MHSSLIRRSMAASGLIISLALAVGCSEDTDSVSSASDPESPSTTSAEPEVSTSVAATEVTTPVAETTVVEIESTTTAETTTTAAVTIPAPSTSVAADGSLVLYADGIGAWKFGEHEAAAVVPALVTALSAPISDEVFPYPVIDGPAFYVDEFGEFGFAYPVGRLVCFDGGLCAEFGGASAPTVFVGWSQGDPTRGTALATIDGITIGSRWSDHAGVMNVFPGGCYSAGTGTTRGIDLSVISTGILFGEFTADGGYVESLPDQNDVFVELLSAGDLRIALFADC